MNDNRMLRVSITDDQGVLLDAKTLTRGEFAAIQDSPLSAHDFVNDFEVGR